MAKVAVTKRDADKVLAAIRRQFAGWIDPDRPDYGPKLLKDFDWLGTGAPPYAIVWEQGSPYDWAVYAGQRTQHHLGRSHGCAGISSGHKACRLAFPHQLQANAYGAVSLGPHRLRGLLLHANSFCGIVDHDRQVFVIEGFIQKIA